MAEGKELTAKQAAERAGVTGRYIRQLCVEGQLEGRQVDGWLWLIDAKSLDRWIAERRRRKR